MKKGKIDVVLGLQWGDEGKGKIVDFLTPDYDIVARWNGGPNAGHTLIFGDNKLVLHTVPSGVLGKQLNLIGAGVVIDPTSLKREVDDILKFQMNLKDLILIAEEASIILPVSKLLDKEFDSLLVLGTTGRGIGPTYANHALRIGLLVRDIYKQDFKNRVLKITNYFNAYFDLEEEAIDSDTIEEFFRDCDWLIKNFEIVSSSSFVNSALSQGKIILAEGAQGALLDTRFGTYPYVTSSPCITGGVLTGLGVGPHAIDRVYGVFKAYCTRVGNGPMPGEMNGKKAKHICEVGQEFGATTGRARRPGWLDLVALKYAIEINGVTHPVMTKADVLDGLDEIQTISEYQFSQNGSGVIHTNVFRPDADILSEVRPIMNKFPSWQNLKSVKDKKDLPIQFQQYRSFIEEKIGVPLKFVSNGPDRTEIIPL